ncbi:MAG: ABC transporter ATP-binding protein/permease [Clostridia bacterium]|nr:ABC transporter ATP-binding protein/permease [Clostridia bacterium]MDE7328837.1 ABC transporter ATP-binding protein/permease [Clostridia bacterium]
MKTIIKYYRRYALYIVFALAFLACEAICELQLPDYMSNLVAYGIASGDMGTIWHYGWQMIVISTLAFACSIAVGFLSSKIAANLSRDLRRDIFKKVMGFASEEYNKFSVSSLITRSTNDITQIQMLTILFFRLVMFSPIMGIGGVVQAIRHSSGINGLAYVIVGALAVVVLLIILALAVVQPKFIKMQKQIDNVNQIANDELNGMLVIRAFNTQAHEEKRFDKANKELTSTSLFTTRMMALLMPVMTVVMNGVMVAIVWIFARNVQNVDQVANMMAFMQYAMHIIMSFMMLSMIFVFLPRAIVSIKRVNEVLNMPISIKNAEGREQPEGIRFKGDVKFENVSYSYGGGAKAVEGITFEAKSGQVTALIGSTGSGKSTIVNLIPRLMDCAEGRITIDGRDIRDINLKDLRNNIGFVPQKNTLFSGTVASNIGYGVEEATAEVLSKAADIAQASEFINSSPDGMAREIAQGGSNVSGGQKQRIAIARALSKNAPINIFDDSFSALDFKTDAKLRIALGEEMSNSSVIIVAQRVGTIKNADTIVVLDDGKIVGTGKHEELLKTCPTYLDIAKSQLSEEELGL